MGGSSSIMKPQELTEFRKLNTSIENVDIPARPDSRALTDKKGFLIFGIFILIFLAFYGYSLANTDIRRLSHGYDNCGNLCGCNNTKIKDVPCSGKNYTLQPYYQNDADNKDYRNSKCLRLCPSRTKPSFAGRCEPEKNSHNDVNFGRDISFDDNRQTDKVFKDALAYWRSQWWKFVLSIIITIALCVVVLFLLRFSPEIVVWTVLAISLLALVAATGALWYFYFVSKSVTKEAQSGFLGTAIVFTIITIIVIVVLICLFKKIRLVIILYKETTKAIFAMPLLILLPVLFTVIQVVILAALITSTVWLATAANLQKISDDYYEYQMNGVMVFTIFFNLVMSSWTMQLIVAVQYMVISGSVASWYFAKNKQYLDSPIATSFLNAVKFHLGTAAFGSFIITLMAVIKAVIRSLIKNDKVRIVFTCCCENVEAFLKFLSKNAYIETAIHGQSFLRSGRRAAKLLLTNATSMIAINSVGDFVLGMIQFLLIVISTGISFLLWKGETVDWSVFPPSFVCFVINVVIVVIIFAIFETTIDTLFICFCEDKIINDGISKPFYMSRGLMEFVENSKLVYGDERH